MQLNKVLKGLMIALPVMAIAACSFLTRTPATTRAVKACRVPALVWTLTVTAATCLLKSKLVCRCSSCSRTTSFTLDLDKYDIRSDFAAMLDATLTSCAATRPTK